VQPFPTDWEKARGIWMMDYNNLLLLARSPVEEVAGAIAEDAEVWERDVLGRQVVVGRDALFVFRLQGHRWSTVVPRLDGRAPFGHKGYAWEQWLSRRLRQPVITYDVSDTCGSVGYTLVEGGEVAEDFFAEDQGSGPAPERSWFTSTRRDVGLGQIGNIYDFASDFFVEQDALEPGIAFGYFVGDAEPDEGASCVVENPGFGAFAPRRSGRTGVTLQIERVDYLVLRPRIERHRHLPGLELPPEPP
jgi:hypothetical protein